MKTLQTKFPARKFFADRDGRTCCSTDNGIRLNSALDIALLRAIHGRVEVAPHV